jgi:hypothetical protein
MQSEPTAFKTRSFGQIIGDSFNMYFTDLPAFMGIAAAVIPAFAICGGILWAFASFGRTAADGWPIVARFMVTQWLRPFVVGLLGMLAYVFLNGAVIHATGQRHLGLPVSIRQACLATLKKAGRLTGAYLLDLLLYWAMSISWICLPFALSEDAGWLYVLTAVSAIGLPFALYFSIKWLFVLQTVLLEGRGITQAFPRSSYLVAGNWWRCFGIWVFFYFAPFVLGFSAVAFPGYVPGFSTVFLLGIFLLVLPLSAVAQTLLYFDLRTRKEEFNSEVLARELRQDAGEAPPGVRPEHAPQADATADMRPRSLNPLPIVMAIAVLLAALAIPAVLLLPDHIDHGDIQVSVRRISTGETAGLNDGNPETIDYTDFVFVVDNEGGSLEPYFKGEGSWMKGLVQTRVFTMKGTREQFLAGGMPAENDPANEMMVFVDYGGYGRMEVWRHGQDGFPPASQVVLHLDFEETGEDYTMRLFTL